MQHILGFLELFRQFLNFNITTIIGIIMKCLILEFAEIVDPMQLMLCLG